MLVRNSFCCSLIVLLFGCLQSPLDAQEGLTTCLDFYFLIEDLIDDLDDEDYRTRESATEQLVDFGLGLEGGELDCFLIIMESCEDVAQANNNLELAIRCRFIRERVDPPEVDWGPFGRPPEDMFDDP